MTGAGEPRVGAEIAESPSVPEDPSASVSIQRNFGLGVANGALMKLAHAFEDPRTVLSVFVLRLTSSDAMVGLVAGIFMAGWYLPQFLVSSFVEHKKIKLPYYVLWSKIRIVSRIFMVLSVFVIGGSHPTLLFWTFLVLWTTTSLGAGFAGVPFLEIVAKTIPTKRRGSFFGVRRLIGGLLGIGAGFAAKEILAPGFPAGFPMNYGILMALATVCAGVAIYAFSKVEEPLSPVSGKRRPFMEHLRDGFGLIGGDSNYRRFLLTRVLWSLTAMAFPFYAVYAVTYLGMPDSSVGLFLSLWVGGSLLADFIWSQVIDRSGSRAGLIGSAVLALAAPIVACVVVFLPEGWGSAPGFLSRLVGTDDLDGRHVLFMSTFILNSFAFDGRLISNMTYLLEMAPPERRPTYVGLANTVTFPLALLPAAGGVLAGLTSYVWLFAAAGGFAVIGLWAVKGLMVGTGARDRKEVVTVERR